MKKLSLILAAAAMLLMTACTKDDSAAWINGTSWRYKETKPNGYTYICNLSLRNGGELYISYENSYYASGHYRYSVKSYTYDGDKSGTIELSGMNYYAEDHATATFTLNYNKEKMSISTPNGSYTMERTN